MLGLRILIYGFIVYNYIIYGDTHNDFYSRDTKSLATVLIAIPNMSGHFCSVFAFCLTPPQLKALSAQINVFLVVLLQFMAA